MEQGAGSGGGGKDQRSKEQRAKSRGRELETPRVSVIDYPFSVIRWTKGSRITGQVAAGRGERRLSAVNFQLFQYFKVKIDDFPGMFLAFLAKRAGTHAVTGGASTNPPNDRNVRGYHPNTTR